MDVEAILPFAAGVGILEGAEFDLAIGANDETRNRRVAQSEDSVVRRRHRCRRRRGAGRLRWCCLRPCGARGGGRRCRLCWCCRLRLSRRRGGAALLLLLLELALQHLDALLHRAKLLYELLVGFI